MSLTAQIANLDGSLRLDLAPEDGYRRVTLGIGGHQFRLVGDDSAFADGDVDVAFKLIRQQIPVVIKVEGSTWVEVETRVEALVNAVKRPFKFTVAESGVSRTWRCSVANVDASFNKEDVLNLRRIVTLDIPAQPNPVVTGI